MIVTQTDTRLPLAEKTRCCICFWVAQRFTAAMKPLFESGFSRAEPSLGKPHSHQAPGLRFGSACPRLRKA